MQCPAGTYSYGQVGRRVLCDPCPVDHVCANSTVAEACPVNTVAQEGSWDVRNCTCMAGYECLYKKVLTFRILFNATGWDMEAFQNNSVLMEEFQTQIANTCAVDPSKVTIVGVEKVEVSL